MTIDLSVLLSFTASVSWVFSSWFSCCLASKWFVLFELELVRRSWYVSCKIIREWASHPLKSRNSPSHSYHYWILVTALHIYIEDQYKLSLIIDNNSHFGCLFKIIVIPDSIAVIISIWSVDEVMLIVVSMEGLEILLLACCHFFLITICIRRYWCVL